MHLLHYTKSTYCCDCFEDQRGLFCLFYKCEVSVLFNAFRLCYFLKKMYALAAGCRIAQRGVVRGREIGCRMVRRWLRSIGVSLCGTTEEG